MNFNFNERTSFAMDISRKAGTRILEIQDGELHIQSKDEGSHTAVDIVTIADTESERVIFSELEKLFPNDGFIGEEGTNKESKNGYVWVVDPLDGTMNFSCKLPIYGVSVGYMYNGKPYDCVIMSMTGLASGKFDGNIIKGPALWDICAGAIIVEEAGGKLVKFDGSPIDYTQIENHELLATNGILDLNKLLGSQSVFSREGGGFDR